MGLADDCGFGWFYNSRQQRHLLDSSSLARDVHVRTQEGSKDKIEVSQCSGRLAAGSMTFVGSSVEVLFWIWMKGATRKGTNDDVG
jgi:hypothetical protein